MLLQFLIPSYKRVGTARRAAESILSQLGQLDNPDVVGVWVNDDASPGVALADFADLHGSYRQVRGDRLKITQNNTNLGMSGNILKMITESEGEFWTVLTDDDWLEPKALWSLLQTLSGEYAGGARLMFTPRYSYREDGSLHCVECRPFSADRVVIPPSPANAVRYMRNGFILTGLIGHRSLTTNAWKRNVENGYFPVINFGENLITSPFLFVDRRWFHHTVLNQTHWEAWGKNSAEQEERLAADYYRAVTVVKDVAAASAGDISERLLVRILAFQQKSLYLWAKLSTMGPRSFLKVLKRLPNGYGFYLLEASVGLPLHIAERLWKRLRKLVSAWP